MFWDGFSDGVYILGLQDTRGGLKVVYKVFTNTGLISKCLQNINKLNRVFTRCFRVDIVFTRMLKRVKYLMAHAIFQHRLKTRRGRLP